MPSKQAVVAMATTPSEPGHVWAVLDACTVEATYHPRRPRVGPRHEAVLSRLSFTFALHSPILIPCFTRLQSGFGIT